MWSPDRYMKELYEKETQTLSFGGTNHKEWQPWREQLQGKFRELLGGLQDMGPDLEPRLIERVEYEDYVRERIEITTAASSRMPIYLLLPKERIGKLPVIIGCHGHGYGSKAAIGLRADGQDCGDEFNDHKQFAVSLVKRGFAVVVPELLGFGDRKLSNEVIMNSHTNSCYQISVGLLMFGKTMAGMRIQETMRAIDYALEREEIDGSRLGIIGLSGGGLVSAFTSALDERIRATVVCCYTNTFQDSILYNRHCIDNYIPNILRYAEMPDLIGLIAPRPLFIEAGSNDPLFPIDGTNKALLTLKSVYASAQAPEALNSDIFPGVHEVWGEQSYSWLEKQLQL